MRTRRLTTVLLAATVLVGCGSDDDYANRARPAAPINVGVNITERGVNVSPAEFAAGPAEFIIANQTGEDQQITIETEELGGDAPGIRQTTSPIHPDGTATLKVDMAEGRYEMRTSGDGIRPAPVTVTGRRPSAQNELLQP